MSWVWLGKMDCNPAVTNAGGLMEPTILALLKHSPQGQVIRVRGWIKTKRMSKQLVFLELNDGSTIKNLQAILENVDAWDAPLLARLVTGASVEASGQWVPSPGIAQAAECRVSSLKVIGDADPDTYPLQKKKHSFEFLRELPHLRGRTNTFAAMARLRHYASMAVHRFFQARGFIQVHTPIITASDCEGAGEMFQVTALPLADPPRTSSGEVDYTQDFFGRKTSLTVSGQLEGESYACALGRIYTFGPTFRAEHSDTNRHLAEFWMIEPEAAFFTLQDNMDLAEGFLKAVSRDLLENATDDLEFFAQRVDTEVLKRLEHIAASSFVRMTYTSAVEELQKSRKNFSFPIAWGSDLQSEHERFLAEEVCGAPVILSDYPKTIKAFYMKQNDDGKTVCAMDVLVPRIGEIIGGSEREADLTRLLARMTECGLDPEAYSGYLQLRRFGSVPHAGFGLGFERLLQFITGMANIRDVIPFPRYYRGGAF
jgi:asparaginyl-tRNA synthetase